MAAKRSAKKRTTTAKKPTSKKSATRKATAKKTSAKKTAKTSGRKKTTRKKTAAKKRRYGPAASKNVETEMRELNEGKLRSGRGGKKVTSRKQAVAIGLSQARRKGAKVPKNPNRP